MKSYVFLAPLALLAVTACGDNGAAEKAALEAKEKAAAKAEEVKLQQALDLNINCYAAIKWQEKLLNSPRPTEWIGGAKPYLDYYRGRIETTIGDRVIAAEPPKPELSKVALDSYLDWAVADQIDNVLTKGDRGQSLGQVATCLQSGADFGAGPLSKQLPGERVGAFQQIRGLLNQLGK